MSFERAKEHLAKYGFDSRILEFDVSSATVELAAAAVGCESARIAKTLAFFLGERCILIVAAGDTKIDNKKYKALFGAKAKMIPFDEVEARIGHAVGGVCPFGINDGIGIYFDKSLDRFDTVYPACGSSNSAVKLTRAELELCAGSFTAAGKSAAETGEKPSAQSHIDVCAGWE